MDFRFMEELKMKFHEVFFGYLVLIVGKKEMSIDACT